MEKQIRLTSKEVISPDMLADLIHVFANWENTCSEKDFEEAFKASRAGSDELWHKFKACDKVPYIFYTSLDHKHQIMLLKYIYEQKHKENIENYRMNRAIFGMFGGEGE